MLSAAGCDQSSLIFFSKFVRLLVVVSLAAIALHLRIFSDHQMLKIHLRVQPRFNFEFFTLFCNGLTTFSASKISRWRGRIDGKHLPCPSQLVAKINGVFEQQQKQRLIKLPNVEVSGLFKDYYSIWLSRWTHIWSRWMSCLWITGSSSKFVQEVAKSSSEFVAEKKHCEINVDVNKRGNVITFSLENVLFLVIREVTNIYRLFVHVGVFSLSIYIPWCTCY